MSDKINKEKIEELQARKEALLRSGAKLGEQDAIIAAANGITDPNKLAGMIPYHQMVGTQVVYGAGDAYHDADGVVEPTRKGR